MSSNPQDSSNRRFAPGLNDGTLLLAGTAVLLFAAVIWTARGPNVERTDFSLTYVGAKLVHDGMGHELYNLDIQKRVRNSLFEDPVPLFFEHPPFEAFILSPLAGRSFRSAYLIWGCINASVWLALIALLRKFLPWPEENAGYICMWLLFAPLWVALYQGQSSLFLLSGFALSFALLKRDMPLLAGCALGLGLLKFQFVLPFVLVLLLCKQWRFVAGFAISTCMFLALSVLGIGWTGLVSYGYMLLAIGSNPQNVSYGSGVDMPTIHGFVYALFGSWLGHTGLNVAVALLSLGLLTWVAFQWKSIGSTSTPSFDLTFAAAVAASLVCGSHMFTHDFSPLILPLLLATAHFKAAYSQAKLAARTTAIVSVLFWSAPIYFFLVKWHRLYLLAPVLLGFIWGATRSAKFTRPTFEPPRAVAET